MQEIYFQRFASNTYNLQLSQPLYYHVEFLACFDNFAPAGIKSKNTVTLLPSNLSNDYNALVFICHSKQC